MRLFVLGVLCAFVVGCSQSPAPASAPVKAAAPERKSVTVYDHDGNLFLRLRMGKKQYEVYDPDDTQLCRLWDAPGYVKADNARRPLLRFKRDGKNPKSWIAENESHAVQFTYSPRDDGGFDLADEHGKLFCRLARKDAGFEALDGHSKPLYSLAMAKDRLVMTRADGFKMYEIEGSKSMPACGALALEKFNVLARASLFAFLHRLENGDIAEGM